MGLESATYIQDLLATNPLSSDPRSQGDDHLRLIKAVLRNTFPNIDAAVTVLPSELNTLSGMTGSVLDALAEKVDLATLSAYAALAQAQRFSKAQGYVPVSLGSVSGAVQIDLSLSNVFEMTIASAVTAITFANAVNGKPYYFHIANAGGLAVTLGATWRAAAGAPLSLGTAGTHVIHALYVNGSMTVISVALDTGAL